MGSKYTDKIELIVSDHKRTQTHRTIIVISTNVGQRSMSAFSIQSAIGRTMVNLEGACSPSRWNEGHLTAERIVNAVGLVIRHYSYNTYVIVSLKQDYYYINNIPQQGEEVSGTVCDTNAGPPSYTDEKMLVTGKCSSI